MEIITRVMAEEQGLKYYFTGLACRKGHIAERATKRGTCMECQRGDGAKFRAKNPNRIREWREKNPSYAADKYRAQKDERRVQNALWYEQNRDQALATRRDWYYRDQSQRVIKAYRRKWYEENPTYDREYYSDNREHLLRDVFPNIRKRRLDRHRLRILERFQELAQAHKLPSTPTERDFKYWLAGEIIGRTGWVVHKEVFVDVDRTSRIDLLIPEAKLGLELKLSLHSFTSKQVEEQRTRYQTHLVDEGYRVLIVSLDGSVGVSAQEFLDSLPQSE